MTRPLGRYSTVVVVIYETTDANSITNISRSIFGSGPSFRSVSSAANASSSGLVLKITPVTGKFRFYFANVSKRAAYATERTF